MTKNLAITPQTIIYDCEPLKEIVLSKGIDACSLNIDQLDDLLDTLLKNEKDSVKKNEYISALLKVRQFKFNQVFDRMDEISEDKLHLLKDINNSFEKFSNKLK